MIEDWTGEHSQKFKGGRKVNGPSYQTDFSPFGRGMLGETSNGLELLKSKKHFPPRYSQLIPDWKPCFKTVAAPVRNKEMQKLTDLPCTIHPRRGMKFFNKNQRTTTAPIIAYKSKTHWFETVDKLKHEEESHVRNLEEWERTILRKALEPPKPINSRMSSIRQSLRNSFYSDKQGSQKHVSLISSSGYFESTNN